LRQIRAAPLVTSLATWMRSERGKLSRHADVAKAMDYMRKRCGDDGAGFDLTIGAAADPAVKQLGW
jgi:hypothetical protein